MATITREDAAPAAGSLDPAALSSPLRTSRQPVFALLLATAVSSVGNQITALAVPWFVLQTTGSPTKTGLTAAVTLAPTVLVLLLGGPLIDRTGFTRISIVSDLSAASLWLRFPALSHRLLELPRPAGLDVPRRAV